MMPVAGRLPARIAELIAHRGDALAVFHVELDRLFLLLEAVTYDILPTLCLVLIFDTTPDRPKRCSQSSYSLIEPSFELSSRPAAFFVFKSILIEAWQMVSF